MSVVAVPDEWLLVECDGLEDAGDGGVGRGVDVFRVAHDLGDVEGAGDRDRTADHV